MAIHRIYPSAVRRFLVGSFANLEDVATTINCALMYQDISLNNFNFNLAHETWEHVSGFECTDIDYPGSIEILSKAIEVVDNKIRFNTAISPKRTTFVSNGNITASHAVLYLDSGLPSTSYLLTYIDFESVQISIDGEFSLSWNSSGFFEFII